MGNIIYSGFGWILKNPSFCVVGNENHKKNVLLNLLKKYPKPKFRFGFWVFLSPLLLVFLPFDSQLFP